MPRPTIVTTPVRPETDLVLQHRIEQFLYREAHLLDQRAWEEWEELFAEGGMYWVPLIRDQPDPLNHASIFYEDMIMRDVRRRRLEQERAWSQQPATQAARIIGNVMLVEGTVETESLTVRSTFQMTEWRKRREQRHIAGHYTHYLRIDGGEWRIALKRVDLINCDGVHDCFEIFV